MRFHHCCGAGGLAVLSHHPIARDEVVPAVSWFPAWRGVVQTPLGPVQLLSVHLRPPFSDDGSVASGLYETPPIRAREMEAFAAGAGPRPAERDRPPRGVDADVAPRTMYDVDGDRGSSVGTGMKPIASRSSTAGAASVRPSTASSTWRPRSAATSTSWVERPCSHRTPSRLPRD